VSRDGIDTENGHLTFDQVAAGIAEAVAKLTGDPARAVEILGAVHNESVIRRLEAARSLGEVVLDTKALPHAQYEQATVRTPLIVKLTRADRATFLNEWFGPIAFVIATESTDDSLAIARDAVKGHGALTLAVYSTKQDVIDRAVEVAEDVGVALSINLTGGVFVNQSAAFSDFHGTGANPAANAALTDAAYVANRFRVVQHRMHT
jgi:phenylacetic acid degradation protein paaN